MKVNEFYRLRKCNRKYNLSSMDLEGNSDLPLVRERLICKVIEMCQKGASLEDTISAISEFIEYEVLPEWYDFSHYYLQEKEWMTNYYIRFAKWLYSHGTIVERNVDCRAVAGEQDLSVKVHMVLKVEDHYEAYVVKWKNTLGFSARSRTESMKLNNSLELIIAQNSITKFSKLSVGYLFLYTETDRDNKKENILEPFTEGTTQKCNVMLSNISKEKTPEELQKRISEVMHMEMPKDNCYMCRYRNVCKVQTYRDYQLMNNEPSGSNVIHFSESQNQALMQTDGKICIAAGPGSGKTATLVGRVMHMQKAGIQVEHVLMITFTNKAADEIKKRIMHMERKPTVSTMHSLAYQIIRDNEELLPRKIKVVGYLRKMKIIRELMSIYDKPLQGINYSSLYGKNGVIASVCKMFEQRRRNKMKFYNDNEKVDKKEFEALYQEYERIEYMNGFADFDCIIQMCVDLWKEYPLILQRYQSVFRYVMVDEYQDVTDSEAEWIKLLSGEDGNLCVVGDDDQSIYSFRGGTEFYLQSMFIKEGVKKVVLDTNYRSNELIMRFSNMLIQHNLNRVEKTMNAADKKNRNMPQIVLGSYRELEKILTQWHRDGYEWGNMAVITPKNEKLQEIQANINVPTILGKNRLIDDCLFQMVYDILDLCYCSEQGNTYSDGVMYRIFRRLLPDEELKLTHETLYQSILSGYHLPELECVERYTALLKNNHNRIEDAMGRVAVCIRAAKTLGISEFVAFVLKCIFRHVPEDSLSYDLICEIAPGGTLLDLYRQMKDMILLEDDTCMETREIDCVKLLTAHECKGKEYDCVVVWKVEEYEKLNKKENDMETRRKLLYVSMTRARSELVIFDKLSTSGENTTFSNEINQALYYLKKEEGLC